MKKEKTRIDELVKKALNKKNGGLTRVEVNELGDLLKKVSDSMENLSERLDYAGAQVVFKEAQKEFERKEFARLPLFDKFKKLNSKVENFEAQAKRAGYSLEDIQEREEKKAFEEFYKAYAEKYNY
ncbi:hypothetical protein SAMN04488137_1015 [Fictibacillus solisalsi]|uniref:Uncharacterized protein n=1 Tax=Fictibacillus solisalsi TaxID=459525 RepID=A0A1G9UNI8_9BACL|nr:hypothetical protein [Fictibacillus solisalsi]SDM61095.1 hypothetical protein SAMN04488137_1015 [Fictibacillus solisalsi]